MEEEEEEEDEVVLVVRSWLTERLSVWPRVASEETCVSMVLVLVDSVETALFSVDDTTAATDPGAAVARRTIRDSVETVVVVVVVVTWVTTVLSAEPPAPLPSAQTLLRLESAADGVGPMVLGVMTSDFRRSVSVLLCSVDVTRVGAESCKLLLSLGIFRGGMSPESSLETLGGGET